MFGLDKENRELDRDFLPSIVKILFLLAWLVAAAIVVMRPWSGTVENNSVEPANVYGCYRAEGQDSILLSADGLFVPEQEFGPWDYRVIRVKSGANVYFDRPLSYATQDGRLRFVASGANKLRRLALYSRVGGAYVPDYNGEPVAGFRLYGPRGHINYRLAMLNVCRPLTKNPAQPEEVAERGIVGAAEVPWGQRLGGKRGKG